MSADKTTVTILGGGISGLTLAYRLVKKGFAVDLVEADSQLGGLGTYFNWRGQWIDRFYHCQMPSDDPLLALIDELGKTDDMVWGPTRMGFVYGKKRYPFNGALDLLRFNALSLVERIRFGVVSLLLRAAGKGKDLDNIPVGEWLSGLYGPTLWKKLLEPLFKAKFGDAAANLPALYIWQRLGREKNKSDRGYLKGGLKAFLDHFEKELCALGVNIHTNTRVTCIDPADHSVQVRCDNGKVIQSDWAISTLPFPVLKRSLETSTHIQQLPEIPYQGVVNALFFLKRPLDNYYWTPVMHSGTEFDGLVEMTELIDTAHYGGYHAVYAMRYTPQASPLFAEDKEAIAARWKKQLLSLYTDIGLSEDDIVDVQVFKAPYVEPLYPLGYASSKPGFSIPGTRLLTISTAQVYPDVTSWNSAVRLANAGLEYFYQRLDEAAAEGEHQPSKRTPILGQKSAGIVAVS